MWRKTLKEKVNYIITKKRKKSPVLLVVLFSSLIFVNGCKSNVDESESNNEILDETKSTGNMLEQNFEYMYDSEIKLDGNVVIRPHVTLLLKTDGTVIGRGESNYGELGNGERTGSEDWTYVTGLEHVKKIYADGKFAAYSSHNMSENDIEAYATGECYALTEDGDVYQWGAYKLTPEIFLSDVNEIKALGKGGFFVIEYKDGHQDLFRSTYSFMSDKVLFDISEIVGESDILTAYDGLDNYNDVYIVAREKNSKVTSVIGVNYNTPDINYYNRAEVYRVDVREFFRHEMGDNIESADLIAKDEVAVISSLGEINRFTIENNEFKWLDEWDGMGYKTYTKIPYGNDFSIISLIGNTVETIGKNKYGELGDGTELEYYNDWFKIDEFECLELNAYTCYDGIYCVALDYNGNIWCWGEGYGSLPEIVFHSSRDYYHGE